MSIAKLNMKHLVQAILDILRQNKIDKFLLLFFILLLSNCKEEKRCNVEAPVNFINFTSKLPIREVKVYKQNKKNVKDSMIFHSSCTNSIKKNERYYFVELKENFTNTDTLKVIINNSRDFVLTGIKYGKTPVKTNFKEELLCEIQEYRINNTLIKGHGIIINVDSK